jgi:Cof subfamily protein (haloacid dehalogenase superfamily)
MRYRLIAADVDGTLVDDRRKIPPAVREALAEARAGGCHLTLATGRMYASVLPFAEAVRTDVPLILYNGAALVERGTRRVTFRRCLPLVDARLALTLLKRFPLHVNLYAGEGLYIEQVTPAATESMVKDGVQAEPVEDLVAFLHEDPVKLLCIGEPVVLEAFRVAFLVDRARRGLPGQPPHLVRSEPTYLEVLPPGVNKGVALAELARQLGIPLDQVVAFGDNLNDLEMLEVAGLGVAVGNAHPDLKASADLVAGTNNEGGMAAVIREVILGDAGGRRG